MVKKGTEGTKRTKETKGTKGTEEQKRRRGDEILPGASRERGEVLDGSVSDD